MVNADAPVVQMRGVLTCGVVACGDSVHDSGDLPSQRLLLQHLHGSSCLQLFALHIHFAHKRPGLTEHPN